LRRSTVVILGAGHSGLAMSRCLAERSIDHVLLERGEVAQSWKRERWDSLRLLTPNWQTQLPGYAYAGTAPDDFMAVPELVAFIEGYAQAIAAPVHTHTAVTKVSRDDAGYVIDTNDGPWQSRAVVIATGSCNIASVPKCAASLPPSLFQLTPLAYKRPSDLPEGGVLVVGASATGVQLAAEIHGSGRPATLAVGEHVRLPRRYRGRDIQWWMDAAGLLDMRYDEVDDLVRARNVPSPQLVGTPDRSTLDLNTLTARGVRLVGRLAEVRGSKLLFSGSLRNVCALADLKQTRLLNTLDEWAAKRGLEGEVGPSERYEPTRIDADPCIELDLERAGIRSVVWATGFRPDYSWLDVPVLDHKQKLRHTGGVVDSPGMYLLGETFLRRRKSSFIHGAEADTRDLSEHLVQHLG
jgi:putative flavoprotein involved in K+ transport